MVSVVWGPGSVVEYLQGRLGQPEGGFPEPLRSTVVKDRPLVTGRPGQGMPPLNLKRMEGDLRDRYEWRHLSQRDVLSAALYPKVFDGYMCAHPAPGPARPQRLPQLWPGAILPCPCSCCTRIWGSWGSLFLRAP